MRTMQIVKHLLLITLCLVLLASYSKAGVPMPSSPPTGTPTPPAAPSETPTISPTPSSSPLPTPIHEYELPNVTNSGFRRAAAQDIGNGRVVIAFTGVPSQTVVISVVNLATRAVEYSTTWENDIWTASAVDVCYSEGTNEVVVVHKEGNNFITVAKYDVQLNLLNSVSIPDSDLNPGWISGYIPFYCSVTSDGQVMFELMRNYGDGYDIFGYVLSSDLSTNVTAFQKLNSAEGGDERLNMLPEFQVDGVNPEWIPLLYKSQAVPGAHIDFLHPTAGFPALKPRAKVLFNSGSSQYTLRLNATADGNFRVFSVQGNLHSRAHYADGSYSPEVIVPDSYFIGASAMEMTATSDGSYVVVYEKASGTDKGIYVQLFSSDLTAALATEFFSASANPFSSSVQVTHVSPTPGGGYTVIYLDRINDRIRFSEFA